MAYAVLAASRLLRKKPSGNAKRIVTTATTVRRLSR